MPRPSRARSPSSASIFRARASTSTRCTPRKSKAVGELTGGIEFLFKKNKVDWLKGYAAFESANSVKVGDKVVTAKNIMIATGSSVTPLPGVDVDNDAGIIVDSTGALALAKVPEHMVVIGGGVIGLELGSVWMRLGAKVTVVEYLDQILPGMDEEVRKESAKIFKKQGFDIKTGTKVTGATVNGGKATLTVEPAKGGEASTIEADVVLVSIGRRPNTDGLGLDKVGLDDSTSRARSKPTTISAPPCRRSGRSATASPARCSRTRPRTRALPRPRISPARPGS